MTRKIVRDLADGNLHRWPTCLAQRERDADDPLTAIVFVHGILSSHRRFTACRDGLATVDPSWQFFYVDYDYHRPIEDNGSWLASTLRNHFREKDSVIIVAHSMGGLISRLAILSERLSFVRMLFLLATPNHGALRTSSLTLLAYMTKGAVGVIWGLRPKKRGIFDLTQADKVLDHYTAEESFSRNARDIDYISIPGRYFHNQRSPIDYLSKGLWTAFFGGLDVGFELTRALLPIFSITLKRAHDGIVEEESNSLTPEIAERTSEKGTQIEERRMDPSAPILYAHIAPYSVKDRLHVSVPDDQNVIALIGDIISAGSLNSWATNRRARFSKRIAYTEHGSIPA